MGRRFIMRMRWGHYGQTFPWARSQGTVNSGVSENLFRPPSTVLHTHQYVTYLLLPCYRLTVVCSFSNGDASLTIKVDDLSPPPSSVNQGSLSLALLSYPGKAGSGFSWLGSIWSFWRGEGGWVNCSGTRTSTVLVCFPPAHPCCLKQMPQICGPRTVFQPTAVEELETLSCSKLFNRIDFGSCRGLIQAAIPWRSVSHSEVPAAAHLPGGSGLEPQWPQPAPGSGWLLGNGLTRSRISAPVEYCCGWVSGLPYK